MPNLVKQTEETKVEKRRAAIGTTIAAILTGDSGLKDLVCVSVYDQKPVYFLSTITETIEWVEKEKKVYSKSSQSCVTVKFLRLNINNEYNLGMGHVDHADQLRNQYRWDKWTRKRKWWWAIWLWGMQLLKVNAFVCYKKFMESEGCVNKDILSHYDFVKAVALSFICPEQYWKTRAKPTVPRVHLRTRIRRPFPSETPEAAKDLSTIAKKRKQTPAPYIKEAYLARNLKRLQPGNHFPTSKHSIDSVCQLHNFLYKKRIKLNVSLCSMCDVHLCYSCWEIFHTQTLITKPDNTSVDDSDQDSVSL